MSIEAPTAVRQLSAKYNEAAAAIRRHEIFPIPKTVRQDRRNTGLVSNNKNPNSMPGSDMLAITAGNPNERTTSRSSA